MKDNMKPCQHSLDEDMEYKEVVVIGNGPSGMVASFMLAGNVPYLKQVPEDLPIDEMLRVRLSNLPEGVSLYEADLMALAEGLEGRSQNPVPLLMDNLLRPCADLGIMADPLIEWKYEADKEISHIVLGKGPPGGSWHTFPAGIRTLSPGSWLVLPPHAANTAARQSAAAVAKYCRRYVHATNIQRYFRSNVVVTSVSAIGASPSSAPCGPTCTLNARYTVTGYEITTGSTFTYTCARVVVCGGGSARPNLLPAAPHAHAVYDLPQYDRALKYLTQHISSPAVLVVGGGVSGADGVWAARRRAARVLHVHRGPADTLARLDPHTYPDYTQVYKMMLDGHSTKYPNYTSYPNHMILDVTSDSAPLGLQNDEDLELSLTPKKVTLLDLQTDTTFQITVHLIGVFIGSKPDLSFLQTNYNLNIDICECTSKVKRKIEDKPYKNHWHYLKTMLGQGIQSCKSRYLNIDIGEKCDCELETKLQCECNNISLYADGIGFGIDPKKPVDSRNPIAIDKSTHEVLNAPKGMYALGPLTADNFVRFIPGGALATVAHIHKDRYT